VTVCIKCSNASRLTNDSGSNVLCLRLWSIDIEADRSTDWNAR